MALNTDKTETTTTNSIKEKPLIFFLLLECMSKKIIYIDTVIDIKFLIVNKAN